MNPPPKKVYQVCVYTIIFRFSKIAFKRIEHLRKEHSIYWSRLLDDI